MNEIFPAKMLEAAGWLMLDPVVPEHIATVIGLSLVLGVLSYRKMAESLGASNWTLIMAVISYALGLAAMLAGLAAADMFVLPSLPKDIPYPAYAAGVLVVMLLGVAAPIGKLLMKCGYAATASAWVTALMVSAVIVFFADLGFTHYGPKMARVLDLNGAVLYRTTKGGVQEEIKRRRMGLPIGAEITTKADCSVTIDLGAGGYVAVRPLSVVRLRAVGEQTTIEVDVGRIIGSVQHTAKTKFQVITPAATTGIVGTDFQVVSDSAKQTFVTVATGKVNLTSTKTSAAVEIGPGQTANCANSGSPTPARPADPADVTQISRFKTAVGEAINQRGKPIESAL